MYLLNVLLFVLGLVLLIKGGDWFVDGATGIARRLHMPELLIGATVVSIGTTLPEVMVSAGAALEGHGEIAYGNAVGSIICNTALIAALSMLFRPAKAERRALVLPSVFFFGAAAVYAASAYLQGGFSRASGALLLAIFLIYMVLSLIRIPRPDRPEAVMPLEEQKENASKRGEGYRDVLLLIVGAALIAFGADLLVDNGIVLARAMGVPESVVALTFVALGTSLPELVTAVTSLIKGHGALSLGNIIGANLFNLVLVSGVSILLSPFSVPSSPQLMGQPLSLVLDLPLAIGAMAILTLPTLIGGRTFRLQGGVLLLLYVGFCVLQFAL